MPVVFCVVFFFQIVAKYKEMLVYFLDASIAGFLAQLKKLKVRIFSEHSSSRWAGTQPEGWLSVRKL